MTIWEQLNASASDTVEEVAQSVVQIVSEQEGAFGAGVVWRSDGIILTNAHVALGRQTVRQLEVVLSDNRKFGAKLLAYDKSADLAVLEIEADNLTPITLGDSSALQPGQYLMALGHPWGMVDALTGGVVIGVGANLPESDAREWVATSLKMRPGHSGGALFNAEGELVGINTMIRGPEVSYAVPVNIAKIFMHDALKQLQREQVL
jgi:S1-C subfamily serine protease